MSATATSFHDLETVHEQLDELFARHQDAVVERDLQRARMLLAAYRNGLEMHIADEEERLLPVYGERVGEVPGASPQMIRDEHRKLLELLTDVEARLEKLGHDATSRDVVALLDLEHRYKGLVEHHHLREHNLFYPKLDEATTADERAEITAGCTFRLVVSATD